MQVKVIFRYLVRTLTQSLPTICPQLNPTSPRLHSGRRRKGRRRRRESWLHSCARASSTAFTFAPAEIAKEAAVCRRSCAVTRGNGGVVGFLPSASRAAAAAFLSSSYSSTEPGVIPCRAPADLSVVRSKHLSRIENCAVMANLFLNFGMTPLNDGPLRPLDISRGHGRQRFVSPTSGRRTSHTPRGYGGVIP